MTIILHASSTRSLRQIVVRLSNHTMVFSAMPIQNGQNPRGREGGGGGRGGGGGGAGAGWGGAGGGGGGGMEGRGIYERAVVQGSATRSDSNSPTLCQKARCGPASIHGNRNGRFAGGENPKKKFHDVVTFIFLDQRAKAP